MTCVWIFNERMRVGKHEYPCIFFGRVYADQLWYFYCKLWSEEALKCRMMCNLWRTQNLIFLPIEIHQVTRGLKNASPRIFWDMLLHSYPCEEKHNLSKSLLITGFGRNPFKGTVHHKYDKTMKKILFF